MKKMQDAVLEAIEALLTNRGLQPLISWSDATSGVIYVSMPGDGGALNSTLAFNIAFSLNHANGRFQVLPANETPRIWPQGGPDVYGDFPFAFHDRKAFDEMLKKLDRQLDRLVDP